MFISKTRNILRKLSKPTTLCVKFSTSSPQIISKALIKPSCPTPKDLKTYNLSLIDQFAPRFHSPLVLFYPNSCNINDISSRLKKSLSEAFTHYYPFAGRLSGKDHIIDCSDEGLDFYEAPIDCNLYDILKKPDHETIDLFSPPGILFSESFQGSPYVIQVAYFSCGGIALSVCMLHKVTDGCSFLGFVNDWAAVARGEKISPIFLSQQVISSLSNGQITIPEIKIKLEKDNVVTRRFSFDPSKLADLKAINIVRDNSGMLQINPSRVEVVTSLIYKCAMAASTVKAGILRPSMLFQTANLRSRVVPPLPKNSVGNFCWSFSIMTTNENDNTMKSIAAALKNAAAGFFKKFGNGLTANKCYLLICESIEAETKMIRENKSEIEVYRCSSLCRYPFNEMNFGLGRPIWVGMFNSKIKNTFILMDSLKPEGIEALVTLEKDKMAILEKDEELLRFAIINPTAIGD